MESNDKIDAKFKAVLNKMNEGLPMYSACKVLGISRSSLWRRLNNEQKRFIKEAKTSTIAGSTAKYRIDGAGKTQ